MTTLYKKVGRRYVPVKEYDEELTNSYHRGTHLVISEPGHKITRFNIKPEHAPLIAAGIKAEETLSKALVKASDLRPSGKLLTVEQKRAWNKLSKSFGEDCHMLQWPSAREASEEAMGVLREEAEKLLTNDTIKKAYEHFLLVCELSK